MYIQDWRNQQYLRLFCAQNIAVENQERSKTGVRACVRAGVCACVRVGGRASVCRGEW